MIYAVGDLHGHVAQLERVLALIDADGGHGETVVFLGDYVDRGPDSRAVIETLRAGQAEGRSWITIKGNHDRMFERFVTGGGVTDPVGPEAASWLHPNGGGGATLASYGVTLPDSETLTVIAFSSGLDWLRAEIREAAQAAVPQAHLDFLQACPLAHETAAQIFVHAGLRPGIPLAKQTERDLLWIREPFLFDTRDHGKLVVHGHTPMETATHYGNRLNLDSGAGYGAPATVAVLKGREAWALSGAGRVPLRPVA